MITFPLEYLIKKLYYDIYKEQLDDEYITSLIDMYKSEYMDVIEKEFKLEAYTDNPNYNKIFYFLINRYAKLRALCDLISKLTRNYSDLPSYFLDLVLIQFGISGYNELTDDQKRIVLNNIIEYITKRGTKKIVQDAIQTYSLMKDIEIEEFDLVGRPDHVFRIANIQSQLNINIDEIVETDKHWNLDSKTLSDLYDNKKIVFPLRVPYFTLSNSTWNINKVIDIINFIYYIMAQEIELYLNTGYIKRNIYISLFDRNLSFTELWLLITVLFNRLYRAVDNNNLLDNSQVSAVIIYDEDVNITTAELEKELQDTITTNFPELKELSVSFYLNNYDNFTNLTYNDFKVYIESNWADYYALEPEVADAILYSVWLSLLTSKNTVYFTYFDEFYKSLLRLPKDYKEKYLSCPENINVGLLYYVYDQVLKGNMSDNTMIMQIVKDPELQLQMLSEVNGVSKLIEFINKIFDNFSNVYTSDDPDVYDIKDILLLIFYLIKVFSNYIKIYFGIDFPTEYFMSSSIFDTTLTVSNSAFINSIKPMIAREIITKSGGNFILDNRLTESIPMEDYERLKVFRRLYDDIIKFSEYLRTYNTSRIYDEEYKINDAIKCQLQNVLFDDKQSYGENLYYRVITQTDSIAVADANTTSSFNFSTGTFQFPGFIIEQNDESPFGIQYVDSTFIIKLTPSTIYTNN